MNPVIQIKKTIPLFLVSFVFACFAFLSTAQAVLPSPTPDGGYPNNNTAEGTDALFNLTTGFDNTAIGEDALFGDTTGHSNTAIGRDALESNQSGIDNTATGVVALVSNTTGGLNTATGFQALFTNTTGSANTAIGFSALLHATGSNSTALGGYALYSNSTGVKNTATGFKALFRNTTGNQNIALGANAGDNLTTGDNNIDIGNPGVAGDHDTIRIGNTNGLGTFIDGIYGVSQVPPYLPVAVTPRGQLFVVSSSRRFKKDIKPMDAASEAILALKPVAFHYKGDTTNTPQFGLVAEDVADVNPALVVRDKNNEIYAVRYEQVNAMLLNEFLKEHKKVEEQQAAMTELRSLVAEQQKQIDALTAGLQKVSAQLELNKPAPQTVLNSQ